METHSHILSRAVIISEQHILVAKALNSSNTFLPGGHVELGESIPMCLQRELKEELGFDTSVTNYLGAVEHQWHSGKTQHYEINHCFRVECANLHHKTAVRAKENHLSFHWLNFDSLASWNLQPKPLQQLVPTLESDAQSTWWASTL
ncbi:MAG: NUDIX domain-containing protein [Deinococcota bacterium]